jgi:hypothetical protein
MVILLRVESGSGWRESRRSRCNRDFEHARHHDQPPSSGTCCSNRHAPEVGAKSRVGPPATWHSFANSASHRHRDEIPNDIHRSPLPSCAQQPPARARMTVPNRFQIAAMHSAEKTRMFIEIEKKGAPTKADSSAGSYAFHRAASERADSVATMRILDSAPMRKAPRNSWSCVAHNNPAKPAAPLIVVSTAGSPITGVAKRRAASAACASLTVRKASAQLLKIA